jgi:hypothetical protein
MVKLLAMGLDGTRLQYRWGQEIIFSTSKQIGLELHPASRAVKTEDLSRAKADGV